MCCDKRHANKSIKSERFFATVHCADTDEHSYKPTSSAGHTARNEYARSQVEI
jgi:hypothetical protein